MEEPFVNQTITDPLLSVAEALAETGLLKRPRLRESAEGIGRDDGVSVVSFEDDESGEGGSDESDVEAKSDAGASAAVTGSAD